MTVDRQRCPSGLLYPDASFVRDYVFSLYVCSLLWYVCTQHISMDVDDTCELESVQLINCFRYIQFIHRPRKCRTVFLSKFLSSKILPHNRVEGRCREYTPYRGQFWLVRLITGKVLNGLGRHFNDQFCEKKY